MEERIINRKELSDRGYNCVFGGESSCFYNDKEILKIIHSKLLKDDREKIIKNLYYFDNSDIVTPLFSLTEKNKFIGYGMEYLNGYIDFADYLDKDNTSFEERKELMIRLSKIFDYFDKMKFAYYDLHAWNILYKDGDIKLIDLDAGVIKGYINDGLDYNTAIRISKKNLAKFTLHTINYVNEFVFNSLRINKKKKNVINFMNSLPQDVRNLYEYALNNDFHCLSDITSSLENITKDMYEDTKDILNKRLRLY